MKLFDIFQQRRPVNTRIDGPSVSGDQFLTPYEVDIVCVGVIEALSGSHAIDLAKRLPIFLKGRQLARFPLVAPARS